MMVLAVPRCSSARRPRPGRTRALCRTEIGQPRTREDISF